MNIVISNTFPAVEHNKTRAQRQRIKDEIKSNFVKKKKKRSSIVTINNAVMLVVLTVF